MVLNLWAVTPQGVTRYILGVLMLFNGKEKEKKSISICAFLLYLLLKLN